MSRSNEATIFSCSGYQKCFDCHYEEKMIENMKRTTPVDIDDLTQWVRTWKKHCCNGTDCLLYAVNGKDAMVCKFYTLSTVAEGHYLCGFCLNHRRLADCDQCEATFHSSKECEYYIAPTQPKE